VDFNSLFFGLIIVLSMAVFLYVGKFRASEKQRNRDDKINWQSNRYRYIKIIILVMGVILGIALLTRLFIS
jgi:hypothetical protein|tara:strand:+ start:173 stop:385 length:213 start_codon:yes stop_codon:yes gene_type:complete